VQLLVACFAEVTVWIIFQHRHTAEWYIPR